MKSDSFGEIFKVNAKLGKYFKMKCYSEQVTNASPSNILSEDRCH